MYIEELYENLVLNKETLSFKKSNAVSVICPHCGKRLYDYCVSPDGKEYSKKVDWHNCVDFALERALDDKDDNFNENDFKIYEDADDIILKKSFYRKLDALLCLGNCPNTNEMFCFDDNPNTNENCGKDFIGLVLFMVDEPVKQVPFRVDSERDLVKEAECFEQYEVQLGDCIIGNLLACRQAVYKGKKQDMFCMNIDCLQCNVDLTDNVDWGVIGEVQIPDFGNKEQKDIWRKANKMSINIYKQVMQFVKKADK